MLEIEEKSRSNVDEERPAKSTNKDKMEAKDPKRIQSKINKNVRRSGRKRKEPSKLKDGGESPNFFTHVGTIVDVLWTEKDLEGTNWESGWYHGEVQRYDENIDKIFVFYFKDRAVYSLNITGAFADGIIRPAENQQTAP